jgi:hypothetical protein
MKHKKMKKIKQFIIKIYFHIIILILTNVELKYCMIVIPIEKLSIDNYKKTNQSIHSNIIQDYFLKDIYGIFEIGTPPQEVPIFLRVNQYNFEITSSIFEKEISYFYKYNLTNFVKINSPFNEEESKTFKSEECTNEILNFLDHKKNCESNDSFIFYRNIDLNKKNTYKNINFTLIKNKRDNITGELGLGVVDIQHSTDKNFLKILKKMGIINNYIWFFSFNGWNSMSGKLIIDSHPHEINPNLFNEKDLIFKNILIEEYKSKTWKLNFDKIFINSTNINNSFYINLNNKVAELVFDSDIIIGTNELEQKLKNNFLDAFIEDKKCFKEKYSQLYYQRFEANFYYCEIELKNILYESLPSINFFSFDYNYTFEITKDILFKLEEKYIYLLILFPSEINKNNFVLGNSVTLRYPFVFNSDSGTVGLYTGYTQSNNSENKENKNNYDNLVKIIIIFLLSVCLIMIGIFIGKKIYGIKRKKRANELSDDYEYKDIEENKEKNIN